MLSAKSSVSMEAFDVLSNNIDTTTITPTQQLAYWDATYVSVQILFAILSCSVFIMLALIGRSKDLIQFFYIGVSVFCAYSFSLGFAVNTHMGSTWGVLLMAVCTIAWAANSAMEQLGAVVKIARVFGATSLMVFASKTLHYVAPAANFWALVPGRWSWHAFMAGHFFLAAILVVALPKLFQKGAASQQRESMAVLSVSGLALGALTQMSLLLYSTGLVDDSPLDIINYFSPNPSINFTNGVHIAYLVAWVGLTLGGTFLDSKRAAKEFAIEYSEMDEDESVEEGDAGKFAHDEERTPFANHAHM